MRSGRPERAGELRDAVGFLQPGDRPGRRARSTLSWRRTVERPVSSKALHRALNADPGAGADRRFSRRRAGVAGDPLSRSVRDCSGRKSRERGYCGTGPRGGGLAQALGWKHLLPLLAGSGLKRADLRKTGEDAAFGLPPGGDRIGRRRPRGWPPI